MVQTLAGKIRIESSCSPFTLKPTSSTTGAYGSLFRVESDISGDAVARFRYTWSTSKLAEMALYGDNSGLSKRVEIHGNVVNESATKQYWQQMELSITNAVALGGAMATETVNGLKFAFFPKLRVLDTTTYDTTNRNIFAENGLRLEVSDDNTFTVLRQYGCTITQNADLNQFVPQRCAIEKTGMGTFAMGAKVIPMGSGYSVTAPDGTNNLVRVVEGGIMPLSADAFDVCQFAFSNNTSIVVDPANAATADYGLRLRDFSPVVADGARVWLRPSVSEAMTERSITARFLTVPSGTPDLTDVLKPVKFVVNGSSWSGRLVKDAVEIDGVSYTRYSAEFEPKGMTIILR